MATNTITGAQYVGATHGDLRLRRRDHRKDSQSIAPKTTFDRAIKEYKYDNFVWVILATHNTKEDALLSEQRFIALFKPEYNDIAGGNGSLGRRKHPRALLLPVDVVKGEEWRPVLGFEGQYEVSNIGRVKALKRVVYNPVTPDKTMIRPEGLMRLSSGTKRDRLMVMLCQGGKEYTRMVHRLVMEAFIGPRPIGMHICHKNDIQSDNRLDNLYYGTAKENAIDRDNNGRTARGMRAGNVKLIDTEVFSIIEMFKQNNSVAKIAYLTGIPKSTIESIGNSKTWKHLNTGEARWIKKPKKKVLCRDDGRIFTGPAEAATFYGLRRSHISAVCLKRKHHHTAGGLHFEYMDVA